VKEKMNELKALPDSIEPADKTGREGPGSAALSASTDYLFLSHHGVEPGYIVMCDMIGMRPILNLNMRLGEGTGSALAMHMVEAAAKILAECKTFAEAWVTDTVH